MRKRSGCYAQSGFTLLEVIVALAILALSLGVIYQIFGSSLRNTQIAQEYAVAQMYAQSHLAELGKFVPIQEGLFEGNYDAKYHWKLNVDEMQVQSSGQVPFGIRKYAVLLTVVWNSTKGKRFIEVPSFRLANRSNG